MRDTPVFVVSKEDWSLHRKGFIDQERHKQKVKEAIKNNLAEIVSEESIILSDGKETVKVPLRSLEQYRFRFNANRGQRVGQGTGNSKVGDVLGEAAPQEGAGKGKGAGGEPGSDYYEAEITVDELAELIFADLQLPNLKNKGQKDMMVEDIRFHDVRKKGIMGNIDKRRTILQSLKRNSMAGRLAVGPITEEDLRFKTWEEKMVPHSNAVVLAMMDTSGSMGTFEKYIARSYFFWMVRFLRTKYQHVSIAFLAHHTEAKEVTEEQFFTRGESGGTMASSVYNLALELIEQRFPASRHNIYAYHFSDGENLEQDNELCLRLAAKLAKICNMVGYGEINHMSRQSGTLFDVYKKLNHPHFVTSMIREKKDVYETLKAFFGTKIMAD